MDAERTLILRTFEEETAVVAYWHHRLGEEVPDLESGLLRRALLEAYGAGWRMALFLHGVEDGSPPFPPAQR